MSAEAALVVAPLLDERRDAELRHRERDAADTLRIRTQRDPQRRLFARHDRLPADDLPTHGRGHELRPREELLVRAEANGQMAAAAPKPPIDDATSRPRVVRIEPAYAREHDERAVHAVERETELRVARERLSGEIRVRHRVADARRLPRRGDE